jgi:ComF family protein
MCGRCGRPLVSEVTLQSESAALCHVCRRGLYDFDFSRSYGAYTQAMARAIVLLKYHKVLPLGGWFATRLQEVVARNPESFAADVIVPVPVHATRLRERGYNQAELIARPLARHLGIPFRSYLLVRTKSRPDKLKLTLRERWRTVKGAYAIRQGTRVDNLRVLLVDDVMTTGATLDACSRALRGAGASRVVGLVVARAVPHVVLGGAVRVPEAPEE